MSPGLRFDLGLRVGAGSRGAGAEHGGAGAEHGLGTGSREGFYAALGECCPAAFTFMDLLCLCSYFVSDLSRKDFFCLKSDVFCSVHFKSKQKKTKSSSF